MTAAAAAGAFYDGAPPPQLMLPAVLSPGEIYYIAENSMVVCVSQGHYPTAAQPAPLLYSAPQRPTAAVVTSASSSGRKARFHSGSSAPTVFFSASQPAVYSFGAPPPPTAFQPGPEISAADRATVEEATTGGLDADMSATPAPSDEGESATIPELPLNLLNQELTLHGHVQQPHSAGLAQHHSAMYAPQHQAPSHSQAPPPPQMVFAPAGTPAGNAGPAVSASGPQTAAPSTPETTEQQTIRHHKLALSMLKNGSLQTAFSAMPEEDCVPADEESGTNIDSHWVVKSRLVERICGNQGDSVQIACMARCLSDFRPCMAEKEVDGVQYIRLRQHREMSLNVETEYGFGPDEDEIDKKYRIVDDHRKEVVEKITGLVNRTCQADGRKVARLINRNSIAFYAEPGITKNESDAIIAGLKECTNCDCDKCKKLSFIVKFRCIIEDNGFAKLLEQTHQPVQVSYPMMGPTSQPRTGLEMGMGSLTIGSTQHDVAAAAGMSSHLMQAGPYSPLVSMPVTQENAALVSQAAHSVHHAQQHASQQQGGQQVTSGQAQAAYYQSPPPHVSQAATLAVSASSVFAGQPLLTLTTQANMQSPNIMWTVAAAGQQQPGAGAGQQPSGGPPGHALQTPEFLFSTYNVANITPGYPTSVPSPQTHHGDPRAHAQHHGTGHHHYGAGGGAGGGGGGGRHASGSTRQLGGSGQAQAALGGGGGGGLGLGASAKSLIGGSGPQKEKNLPPRLQSQHRLNQAQASVNTGPYGGSGGYGDSFFMNGGAPVSGGYMGGGRGGPGGGRRGGTTGYGGGGRGARARPNNYHGGGFGIHHPSSGLNHASAAITGPGGPMLHAQSPVPTPPDLQADFPQLPGQARGPPTSPGGLHVSAGPPEAMGGAEPTPQPGAGANANAGSGQASLQTAAGVHQTPQAHQVALGNTYAAVVVHGDSNNSAN